MTATEIIQVFDTIVSKASGPAKDVAHIYIKQVVAYGVGDLIGAATIFIISILLFVMAYNYSKWPASNDSYASEAAFWYTFFGIVFCLGGIGLGIRGFLLLYNPAFYFIQDLINAVH